MPDFPSALSEDDNTWYRILQFVEVPSRVNRMLGNYVALSRVPGKLNLNGIRHVEVYAGLIDDALLADVPNTDEYLPFMNDSSPAHGDSAVTALTAGGIRDRWMEFLDQRDGTSNFYDAVQNTDTNYWIPGTPNARPFRPFSYTQPVLPLGATTAAGGGAHHDSTISCG